MAELPAGGGPDGGPDPGSAGTPRWVKIFGVIAAVVIALLIIILLTSGPGGHGPSRHINGLVGDTRSDQVVA